MVINDKKILFLDIYSDNPKLKKRIERAVYKGGTYAEHVRRFSGLKKSEFAFCDATKSKLPNPSRYKAIIIGGSLQNPVKNQEKLWMHKTYAFIRKAVKADVPILGLCGGLQFTVRALGGEVVKNPKGEDFGNTQIQLTEFGRKDLFFKNLPKNLEVLSSHKYMAKKLKANWKLLAKSQKTPIEAVAIGRNIRLVQFHPEKTLNQIKLQSYFWKNEIMQEKRLNGKKFSDFVSSLKDTTVLGHRIIRNFIRYFVL